MDEEQRRLIKLAQDGDLKARAELMRLAVRSGQDELAKDMACGLGSDPIAMRIKLQWLNRLGPHRKKMKVRIGGGAQQPIQNCMYELSITRKVRLVDCYGNLFGESNWNRRVARLWLVSMIDAIIRVDGRPSGSAPRNIRETRDSLKRAIDFVRAELAKGSGGCADFMTIGPIFKEVAELDAAWTARDVSISRAVKHMVCNTSVTFPGKAFRDLHSYATLSMGNVHLHWAAAELLYWVVRGPEPGDMKEDVWGQKYEQQ